MVWAPLYYRQLQLAVAVENSMEQTVAQGALGLVKLTCTKYTYPSAKMAETLAERERRRNHELDVSAWEVQLLKLSSVKLQEAMVQEFYGGGYHFVKNMTYAPKNDVVAAQDMAVKWAIEKGWVQKKPTAAAVEV